MFIIFVFAKLLLAYLGPPVVPITEYLFMRLLCLFYAFRCDEMFAFQFQFKDLFLGIFFFGCWFLVVLRYLKLLECTAYAMVLSMD